MDLLAYDPFFYWPTSSSLLQSNPFDLWYEPFTIVPRSIPTSRRARALTSSEIVSDKDKFQVSLHLPNYKTNEICVKYVENELVVEAEHEPRTEQDFTDIYRHIKRRYKLPRNVDVDKINSTLTDDGLLTIVAPKKPLDTENARNVEIKQVGAESQMPQVGQTQPQQQQQQQPMGKVGSGTALSGNINVPVTHEKNK